jgi:glucosamine-phosphate N-acetyltransferase
LTLVGNISYEDFVEKFNKINSIIYIMEDIEKNKVIGTITILIEEKFIHNLSSVCHIEDLVVDIEYRERGIGRFLIEHCIEYVRKINCYKIILDCCECNINFYQKFGFKKMNVQMALYL